MDLYTYILSYKNYIHILLEGRYYSGPPPLPPHTESIKCNKQKIENHHFIVWTVALLLSHVLYM